MQQLEKKPKWMKNQFSEGLGMVTNMKACTKQEKNPPVMLPKPQIQKDFVTKTDKLFELLSLPMDIKNTFKVVALRFSVPSEYFLAFCLQIHTAFSKEWLNNALFLHCKAEQQCPVVQYRFTVRHYKIRRNF